MKATRYLVVKIEMEYNEVPETSPEEIIDELDYEFHSMIGNSEITNYEIIDSSDKLEGLQELKELHCADKELDDNAYNTLLLLRHTTFLSGDEEIMQAVKDVAEYLEEESND